jgi:hypothetical protein
MLKWEASLDGRNLFSKIYYLHPSIVVVVVKKVRNYHGPNMSVKERKNPRFRGF